MPEVILDEYDLRALPPRERLDKIKEILENENDDESYRWDGVWLAGEMTEKLGYGLPMWCEIADLMVWVLRNDPNGVVKHEAAFQIGLRKMIDKLPELYYTIRHDHSSITRHEAIEALGLVRDQSDEGKRLLTEMSQDPDEGVSETAIFVLKRLKRVEGKGEYKGEAIL